MVVFTLVAPRVIKYEFKCFDAEFYGTFEITGEIPAEELPQMLLAKVSEKYLNGTIAIRKQLALTIH